MIPAEQAPITTEAIIALSIAGILILANIILMGICVSLDFKIAKAK